MIKQPYYLPIPSAMTVWQQRSIYSKLIKKQEKQYHREMPHWKGAVYGLYAREDIVHPDGATGTIYKAGEQVASLTTDDKGQSSVKVYILANIMSKRSHMTRSPGRYRRAWSCVQLWRRYDSRSKRVHFSEQVIKQPFRIIKAANNGKTDADLLSGAGFTVYLKSSLTKESRWKLWFWFCQTSSE